uniref:histidine kinase n=1 Tax=Chromera velia CCMP2878 TaxID=1169474 RepID=A0A0G4G153_9ALVE|eukprot:Cvel_531.t1-p1 / transcript=Cvel_531.t1 / gene=Cvel_531 / organism=Chromera_velia_CCMP2878 / gene_product=hypothetical protein / transcript_product=hypothetical protein / location=Cvel_scaffold16:171748-175323(+) / protein_length=907 / sequence_SO=supercontig / SO=protein_coding / is_pseudo=false
MDAGVNSAGAAGKFLLSFDAWRIHAAKRQLARASLMILISVFFQAVFVFGTSILNLVQEVENEEDEQEETSILQLCIGFIGMSVHILLASPWLRQRPEDTFDKYLNGTLVVLAVCFDSFSLPFLFAGAGAREAYKPTHTLDALWPAIVLSMFDVKKAWYLGILVGHGLVWAVAHLGFCEFDIEAWVTDMVPIVTYFSFLAVSSHSRRGTLVDCFEMNLLREQAEDGYKRFLSYMMHEMRNPIGGAMFLLDDLEFASRRALSLSGTTNNRRGDRRESLGESDSSGRLKKERSHLSLALSRNLLQDRGDNEKEKNPPDSFPTPTQMQTAHGMEMEFLQRKIRSSLESMKSVCDDVLTLEKVQKRGFEYLVSTTDPIAWLRELSDLEKLSMNAENINLKVNIEIAPDLDQAFASQAVGAAADWLHLRQVAVNFLSNARKFTKARGVVTLRFQVERLLPSVIPPECVLSDSESENPVQQANSSRRGHVCDVVRSSTGLPESIYVCGWVRIGFSVTDKGAGLSASDKEKLFLPYSQIRAGELQRGGGSGLGLCISKMFVEAHWGGKVGADSEGPGLGSCFFYSMYAPLVAIQKAKRKGSPASQFPFSISSTASRVWEQEKEIAKRTNFPDIDASSPVSACLEDMLLPAEDRRLSRENCLERGKAVRGGGGDQACHSTRSLDAGLGGSCAFEGPSLTKSLRSERDGHSRTSLGGGMRCGSGDRLSQSHIEGPTSGSWANGLSTDGKADGGTTFDSAQQELLPEPEEMPAGLPPMMQEQVRAYAANFDCLVVDDIWVCAFGAFRTMERLGYRPWMCLSGERTVEVVEKLSVGGGLERLRVILMDKDMPGIDGPETIRRLKDVFSRKGATQPFVIGITGEVAGPGMTVLKEAGANAVLPKPCRPESLKAELDKLN